MLLKNPDEDGLPFVGHILQLFEYSDDHEPYMVSVKKERKKRQQKKKEKGS